MEQTKQKKLLISVAVYLSVFLFLIWIINIDAFNAWFSTLMAVLRPVLIGLVVAYLCNPIFNLFERKLYYRIALPGFRRWLSLFSAYIILLLIIVFLLLLILPQLFDSILNFINNSDSYFETACRDLNALIATVNSAFPSGESGKELIPYLNAESVKSGFSDLLSSIKLDSDTLLGFVNADTVEKLISLAGSVLTLVTDILFGLFISIYLLHTKEKRYAQVSRFRRAFLGDRANEIITRIATTADKSFGGFLKGKLLDSAIVGVLVYISISLFQVPYAILIAAVVAITDIVPIIGPFVGVAPSAIIILLTDPAKVIPFLLCILVIQQFDGNVMAPRILGEHTGVSSLCVLIAITTMGAVWGFIGMVVGVPLFATVLELTGEFLDSRLKKKGLSTRTADYYAPDAARDTAHAEPEIGNEPCKEEPAPMEGGNGSLSQKEQALLESYQLATREGLFEEDGTKNDQK